MELIVPLPGGEIWAEDSGGDGTPVVLVHPGWGNAEIWTPLIGLLPADADLEQPPPPAYDRLDEVRAPTVVVRGDREYPMVAESSDAIAARIAGSRRIVVPGADHLLPLRAPDRLAEIITERAD